MSTHATQPPDGEIVLGFDAREMYVDPRDQWGPDRRATYLLRLDATKPLSIDRLVWPSVAEPAAGPTGLWTNRTDLDERLRVPAVREGGAFAIGAFALCMIRTEEERRVWAPRRTGSERPPDPEWSSLGYDVADLAFISGLSNCGYDPENVDALRTEWGPQLNKHHLFRDVGAATEFKRLTDDRVPEHAPFFVYEVRFVDGVEPD